MEPTPIPDTGTHMYRWSYPLTGTPLADEALRRALAASDPAEQSALERLGGLGIHLCNESKRLHKYYWAVGLNACYTRDLIDPEILAQQLTNIVLGAPGFKDWSAT